MIYTPQSIQFRDKCPNWRSKMWVMQEDKTVCQWYIYATNHAVISMVMCKRKQTILCNHNWSLQHFKEVSGAFFAQSLYCISTGATMCWMECSWILTDYCMSQWALKPLGVVILDLSDGFSGTIMNAGSRKRGFISSAILLCFGVKCVDACEKIKHLVVGFHSVSYTILNFSKKKSLKHVKHSNAFCFC